MASVLFGARAFAQTPLTSDVLAGLYDNTTLIGKSCNAILPMTRSC